MSSNIFEKLQSPDSYDPDIDHGWKRLFEKDTNPPLAIRGLLREVYWNAVTDEFANAILAFDDYKTWVPEGLPDLEEGELQSEYLRELVDLWDPLELSDERKEALCKMIFAKVKERQYVSQDEIIACALLQACGFMDYDYVQEYRKPTFPSLGMAPQVESKSRSIFEAIQCSQCRFCIRSFHFYECEKGCYDCAMNRNHIKTVPEQYPVTNRDHFVVNMLRIPPPFRLCCNCLESSTHPRDHLKVVWRFSGAGEKDNERFGQELDAFEDHVKGQSLLSFGNAFLEHLSALRRRTFTSMDPRQLFPAGNVHCALMFGPLLIENGMTTHPGGALISTRQLPSLGCHSPRQVKEYLCPESFQTVDGLDVFHRTMHSIAPDRRVYEATKKARDRRFLCARKQFSGGLFADYNSHWKWKLGENKILSFFIRMASKWRTRKSPVGPEQKNRTLLKECAQELTSIMQYFFADDVECHLHLLSQKLGKTQKLAYSRMGNNCQDFCNGLLFYEELSIPMFESMYPVCPVSVSDDVLKEPEELCLSFMQSFVKPLENSYEGFRTTRSMLGSALAIYSNFVQNDADLIDHVWTVRGHNDKSYRGSFGGVEGDPYLLKDEEMSCSDRFAGQFEQPPIDYHCTLADHLLDWPVDNLSVLQTHLIRQQKYYFNNRGEFLSTLGAKAWMTNRLEVLRRLKLLNDFLAEIASQFQACCSALLPSGADMDTLRKIWLPMNTTVSRAWHMDRREGDLFIRAPEVDYKGPISNNLRTMTVAFNLFQAYRSMLSGQENFTSRLKTLKSLLASQLSGKKETWKPWEWCPCQNCKLFQLDQICYRVDWNYFYFVNDRDEAVRPGHPDYVSPLEVLKLLKDRDSWKEVIEKNPRALELQEAKEKADDGEPGVETIYLLSLRVLFGNTTIKALRERLEYYKLVFEGKL